MSEIYKRGIAGQHSLLDYLEARGRNVQLSDIKTFDLIVDGVYAEVKSSHKPYSKLGFIGLTDNQRKALQDGKDFILFVVCNLATPDCIEVLEIRARELLRESPKTESHHYWSRSQLERIRSACNNA
jgi:hypothetical protein